MIYYALTAVAEKLNAYFRNRFALGQDKVIISGIVNQDGSIAITDPDKVVLTLVNLQQETVGRINIPNNNPSININLFVLFSVYFNENNYAEGLKFLSAVISFFQANNVLNHQNTPDLDENIDKLVFEMVNQDFQNLSYLWGVLGGKYLPSVLYKVRMITFQEGNITGDLSLFKGLGNNL